MNMFHNELAQAIEHKLLSMGTTGFWIVLLCTFTITSTSLGASSNNRDISAKYVSGDNPDEAEGFEFLQTYDKRASQECYLSVLSNWAYATNLTEENKQNLLERSLVYAEFQKEAWKNATSFAWKQFKNPSTRRLFKFLSILGTAALPTEKLKELNEISASMEDTYSTSKICPYSLQVVITDESENLDDDKSSSEEENCTLSLEPDITRILKKSQNYDELAYVWKAWRDSSGKKIRKRYERFVELSNDAARLNGFADMGEMWRESYESDTFLEDLENLWKQLLPLYENLHAYVRRKLISKYGNDKIRPDGPIPAHLLGNMWAQDWAGVQEFTEPYPGKPSLDVTPQMVEQNMTALDMFNISEEFFSSLGLKEMPPPFWEHSVIEKPTDREIVCHASAWDFCNGKDYRIKQCTDITMQDLITVHHEMGHIEYYLQYADQPSLFREGANPGFHEAVGDVLALSVSTPKHLKAISLLNEIADDPEGDINYLYSIALDKISFLPFGYLMDLWRWGIFSGNTSVEEMNTKWWELRLKYQGVCPPVKRTEEDFDPGAKYHIPGNTPYIRYFVSFVIQFQFHKALCEAAGHEGPLYKCDIYQSKEAGKLLSQVLQLGSSKPWTEAMKIMTGGKTNKMDAAPIIEYFDPLIQWLKEQNKNYTLGWTSNDPTICP
ncbi:angiotensin-converting enzyme-like isoform X1 [Limulus polyphemus]|uniref:Angiotensin-converting enzyme n=2 Tax=Limulus polyphemus TaxID=6850 RepID=A0ABM1SAW9_LIMPO|nr:angiotensin-converting enzyme-like isoform X1 [Limulus polyphemus]